MPELRTGCTFIINQVVATTYNHRSPHTLDEHGGIPLRKILIVTGGSRGIGAATARLAAANGYAVCISYLRNEAAASAVVHEISEAGGEAIAVACDVGQE